MKALLLDVGGVMMAPVMGDWLLAVGYEEILGDDFIERHMDAFREVRRDYLHMLPDTNVLDTDEEEYELFIPYFRQTLGAIGMHLDDEALSRLSHAYVYRDDRYAIFEDVLPWLAQWKTRYKLGIVSDAPPSTRRIVGNMGILQYMDGATFSCELGVLKPDPAIYRRTLDKIGVAAADAVFVDDLPQNLHGAQALGIHAIQMRRPMPKHFPVAAAWDGPIVHDFAELDALLRTL